MEKMTKLFESIGKNGEEPSIAKFDGKTDEIYREISERQLKDELLWRLLERQFKEKSDVNDAGWRGEFWGKLMRGACMVYAYSKDETLYFEIEKSVKNLISLADGDGRISSYPRDNEFFGWDVWGRKYVMLGLEYFYDVAKSEEIKKLVRNALIKHADYIVSKIGDAEGQISIYKTSHAWGAINSVSIIQPFVKLYKLTDDEKYKNFAKMLIEAKPTDGESIFSLAEKNEISPYQYPVTKAYEMISCFEGLLDFYAVAGEEKMLDACVKFADRVLETDFTVIGGIGGKDEYFNRATKNQVVYTEIHQQETCVTVTFMKFLAELYRYTDDKRYIDAVERSFFNAYLGAYNAKPEYYHLAKPVFYSYSPVFDNPRWTVMGGMRNISSYAVCGCCVAIGAAGLGVLPKLAVRDGKDVLTINMFISGEYVKNDGKTSVKISSGYPDEGIATISLSGTSTELKRLRIRIPDWAEKTQIKINGKTTAFENRDGYAVLSGIKSGDVIEADFGEDIKVINSESVNSDVKGMYALKKCATVLCADSATVELGTPHTLTIKDGKPIYEKNGDVYEVVTKQGKMPLTAYRNTGKNYLEPRAISAWIKNEKYFKEN